jgi:hypothetical protein
MKVFLFRSVAAVTILAFFIFELSCAHDQQLVSVQVQPTNITFGDPNIPVSFDRGLAVQLRALGHYVHPPVTKDITDQVTWGSDSTQMVTVNSTGLITATGNACGTGALVSATVQTNSSTGGRSSSGAIVTGNMTVNVDCFTGTGNGNAVLTVTFLGSGTGTVTFQPTGIICPSSNTTCAVSFPVGTAVTLTAATGGVFSGWSPNCPAISGPNGTVCTINSLTTNLALTATFN